MGQDRCREIWRVDLRCALPQERCRALVSDADWTRAQRFRFPQHRRQFLVARAALRTLLGERLGVSAAAVNLVENAYGKPALAAPEACVFNLSHSDEVALIALAPDGELGVDVEQSRPLPHEDLARRHFSAREVDALDRLPEARKVDGFFACWTRKEAYIKAKGLGLSMPLDGFSVEADPDRAPALLESRHAPDDVGRFRFWDLPVPDGYRATVAHAPVNACADAFGFVLRDWTPRQ